MIRVLNGGGYRPFDVLKVRILQRTIPATGLRTQVAKGVDENARSRLERASHREDCSSLSPGKIASPGFSILHSRIG